ncbi:MAG: hypothetical protein A2020_08540 [Lentisphaerae bacterium GWF2_45_14]|nr:MAG: hypothetical protein A2020_08540 [Lentisphaerae bacterium GWF2_45_14]
MRKCLKSSNSRLVEISKDVYGVPTFGTLEYRDAAVTEKALIYPANAYRAIFIIMLCFSCISALFCKETHEKGCL